MSFHHSDYWEYRGNKIRFDIYLSKDFSKLERVTQAYGLVVNADKDKLLLVHSKTGEWILPGGTVEEGETLIQTLIREIDEESDRTVFEDSIMPFYYQTALIEKDGEYKFDLNQVRYIAMVKDDNEFTQDPDHGIIETKWVLFEELDKYLDWGETVDMYKQELPKLVKNL